LLFQLVANPAVIEHTPSYISLCLLVTFAFFAKPRFSLVIIERFLTLTLLCFFGPFPAAPQLLPLLPGLLGLPPVQVDQSRSELTFFFPCLLPFLGRSCWADFSFSHCLKFFPFCPPLYYFAFITFLTFGHSRWLASVPLLASEPCANASPFHFPHK